MDLDFFGEYIHPNTNGSQRPVHKQINITNTDAVGIFSVVDLGNRNLNSGQALVPKDYTSGDTCLRTSVGGDCGESFLDGEPGGFKASQCRELTSRLTLKLQNIKCGYMRVTKDSTNIRATSRGWHRRSRANIV